MKTILSQRQRRLLMYLATSDDWMTGKELAKLMDVSDRTIRTDIESIRKENPEILTTSKQNGYRLNRNQASEFIENDDLYLPQQRVVFIAVKMAVHNEGADIFRLAERLYVSESTIVNDVSILKKEITKAGLDILVEREADIIRMIGSIHQINQILFHLIKDFSKIEKIEYTQRYFEYIDVQQIVADVLTILIEENYFSRYLSLRDLMITIFFICERSVLEQNYQNNSVSETNYLENQLVIRLISYLEALLNIDIAVTYQNLIIDTISNAQEMVKYEKASAEFGIKESQISEILSTIVSEILDIYGLNFKKNINLIADLEKHMHIAIERTRKGIRIRNPIKEKMKQEYPFLFDIGFYISKRIMETVGIEFNSDEISFIVCHLAEAYEEVQDMGKFKNKVRVLLIAFEGKAVLKYIRRKIPWLKDQDDLEITEAITLSELQDLKKVNSIFDLIISTSLAQTDAYKPDLIIRPNIRSVDEFNVKSLINKELDRLKRMNFSKFMTSFFKEKLFEKDLSVNDADEYLRWSVAVLIEKELVPEDFLDTVIERERLISTAMPSQIALPHATSFNAFHSAVMVSIFKRPILWGDTVVRAAMIFAIAKPDVPELNRFYTFISKFVAEKENIDLMCKCNSFDEFSSLLFNTYMSN